MLPYVQLSLVVVLLFALRKISSVFSGGLYKPKHNHFVFLKENLSNTSKIQVKLWFCNFHSFILTNVLLSFVSLDINEEGLSVFFRGELTLT